MMFETDLIMDQNLILSKLLSTMSVCFKTLFLNKKSDKVLDGVRTSLDLKSTEFTNLKHRFDEQVCQMVEVANKKFREKVKNDMIKYTQKIKLSKIVKKYSARFNFPPQTLIKQLNNEGGVFYPIIFGEMPIIS